MRVLKILLFAILLAGVLGGSLWEANDKEEVYKKTTTVIKRIGYLAMALFFILEILFDD